MKIGITHRLFLAILAAAIMSVASMVIIMERSIDRGFLRYVHTMERARLARLGEQLAEVYAARGGWDFLKERPGLWQRLVAQSFPEGNGGPPPWSREPGRPATPPAGGPPLPGRPPGPFMGHGFNERLILLDAAGRRLVGPAHIPAKTKTEPVRLRGGVVGYLGLIPPVRPSDSHQIRFLREQRIDLAMMGGVLLLLAAGLSLPLAGRLVRPIKALAEATGRLAAGEFATRVPVDSGDELGHLARDFNALALTLEKNEQARRQWVADISHELRTPLAVLRGEIEAIQDGIRQPTAGAIRSLHCETLRLGRLVDDLYQLSLSDLGALACHKEELDLARLLVETVTPYRAEFAAKGIALATEIADDREAVVFGDAERLRQLFSNLLDNSLKYTDGGGEAVVRLSLSADAVMVLVEDSAPGVPEESLERLFDRLYRVESSRNRAAGGAGLGLAICRGIAEAHAGTISAGRSPLGGVGIRVVLPRAKG